MNNWIKRFSSLKITSDFFGKEKEFTFFKQDKQRLALIYGGNGSGKSTISNAFNHIKNNSSNDILLDENNNVIKLESEDLNSLLVFNEEYINNKIRFKENGVESIVLIGESAEIDKKIELLKIEEAEIDNKIEEVDKWLEQNGEKNNISHFALMNQCIDTLKKRWALVDKTIKGNKGSTHVNKNIVHDIITNYKVGTDFVEEIGESLAAGLKELAVSDVLSDIIEDRISEIFFPYDVSNIVQLVNNLFEEANEVGKNVNPEIDIPDHIIGDAGLLIKAKNYLSDTEHSTCELCLQKIYDDWRKVIVPIIDQYMNNKNLALIEELNYYKISSYDIAKFNHLRNIDGVLFNSISDLVLEYNNAVNAHNDLIDNKLSKLNKKLSYTRDQGLNSLVTKTNEYIEEFNKKIDDINDVVLSRTTKAKQLAKLNGELAYIEISSNYNWYKKAEAEWNKKSAYLKELVSDKDKINNDINQLHMRLANLNLAMDDINESLSWMFYSKERMVLVPGENNEYKLLINGENVIPSKVSTGERNVLALCYFFVELLRDEKNDEKYKNSKLLIIDDPISSFDYGNKMGVVIVIKSKLSKFFKENPDTKCLLFTHDVYSAYNLFKIFEKYKTNFSDGKEFCKYFELINKELVSEKIDDNNSKYSKNIISIFEFIRNKSERPKLLNTIGNTLRITIEMFCTFNYCEGIEKTLEKQEILDSLKDKKDYYQSLIMRLVFNEQSHGKTAVNFVTDVDRSNIYSESELVRMAMDVINFIDILNPIHIAAHLKHSPTKDKDMLFLKKMREERDA
jgi:wobble nucleotide-excising tRNase